MTQIKSLSEVRTDSILLPSGWDLRIIVNDDNLCYIPFNTTHREALVIDPVREDWETLDEETKNLKGYRFLAVIDSHTHADHVSCASRLSKTLQAPLIMHESAVSRRVDVRISRDIQLPTVSGPLSFVHTPGHTPDSMLVSWGPFLFTGDTILYGDTGRDDLPGGDPIAHYESLLKIKKFARPEMIFLTGHDGSARGCSWKTQLETNPALQQERETFIREAGGYVGPSPRLLKEALFENLK